MLRNARKKSGTSEFSLQFHRFSASGFARFFIEPTFGNFVFQAFFIEFVSQNVKGFINITIHRHFDLHFSHINSHLPLYQIRFSA